jgi:type IV secretion system protein VirB9
MLNRLLNRARTNLTATLFIIATAPAGTLALAAPVSARPAVAASTPAAEAAQTTRDVTYSSHTVIHVNAKLRFTTLVILPETEDILDIVCGDKDNWVISGAHNLAYVKPAKSGAATNLDLVTANGHIFSFWLTEGPADADVKLFVTPDDSVTDATGAAHRYYSAADVDDLKKALDQAKKETEAARDLAAKSAQDAEASRRAAEQSADARVDAFRSTYPTKIAFPYFFKANVKPFMVGAIYHDDKFTYIRANPMELPTLYEIKDGAPNLVNFQVENGVFVVPKVLDRGYLVIGKQKLVFGTTWW